LINLKENRETTKNVSKTCSIPLKGNEGLKRKVGLKTLKT
jgi:hypothetical protein